MSNAEPYEHNLQLEDLKSRREAHIQAVYNELDSLWRRLGVEDTEMDAFVEANRGSTEANVQAVCSFAINCSLG